MNKRKLINFNDFEKDYLDWAYKYMSYKIHNFDVSDTEDSFCVIEADDSLRSANIKSIDELHEVVRKIANQGLSQLSNLSIGIKNFYYYAKDNKIESLDKIDENLVDDFLNIKCIKDTLKYGTRCNYKNAIVGLIKYIKDESIDEFTIDTDNIFVEQVAESKRDNKKLIDWMDLKMIQKANKEIVRYSFNSEFEMCKDILIFRIFCFTGIEPKELMKLREDNFELENGEMNLRIDATPSRPQRRIDMPKAYLIRYFNKYKKLKEHKTDLFFYHHKYSDKPLDRDYAKNVVEKVLTFAEINVRHKTPSMLRKSLAINLNNEKNPETGLTMPEKNIQEVLGIKNRSDLREILMLNSLEVMTASKHFLKLNLE